MIIDLCMISKNLPPSPFHLCYNHHPVTNLRSDFHSMVLPQRSASNMGGSTLWRFFATKINHPIFSTQQFFEKLPFLRLSIWASTSGFITSLTSSGWCRSPLASLTQRQETWPTTSLQLRPGWTAIPPVEPRSLETFLKFSTWDSQK